MAEAEIALRSLVNVSTCCQVLQKASHHNAERLEEFCLKFIVCAHTGSIEHLDCLDGALKAKLEAHGWVANLGQPEPV